MVGGTLILAGAILIMDSLPGDGTTHTTDMDTVGASLIITMDGITHITETVTDTTTTIATTPTGPVDEVQNIILTLQVPEIILQTEPIPIEIQITPTAELLQTDKQVLHLHEEVNFKAILTVPNPGPTPTVDKVPVTTATALHQDRTVLQAVTAAAEDHTLPEVAAAVEAAVAVAEEVQEEAEDKYSNL
jgi:hypothetical protein